MLQNLFDSGEVEEQKTFIRTIQEPEHIIMCIRTLLVANKNISLLNEVLSLLCSSFTEEYQLAKLTLHLTLNEYLMLPTESFEQFLDCFFPDKKEMIMNDSACYQRLFVDLNDQLSDNLKILREASLKELVHYFLHHTELKEFVFLKILQHPHNGELLLQMFPQLTLVQQNDVLCYLVGSNRDEDSMKLYVEAVIGIYLTEQNKNLVNVLVGQIIESIEEKLDWMSLVDLAHQKICLQNRWNESSVKLEGGEKIKHIPNFVVPSHFILAGVQANTAELMDIQEFYHQLIYYRSDRPNVLKDFIPSEVICFIQ